ncbi:MAG: ABC transporter ATP-binding protein [Synergistetes bacterium]|nr:ABC transporter ATP-binding protein [Synergistota bacterium]
MLDVRDLKIAYDDVPVVHGVSFNVKEGEVVSIVGANGAGKTTLLRAIAGLITPVSGKIAFLGEDITSLPAFEVVKRGISYVPEGRRLFSKLSVRENLLLGAYYIEDETKVRELFDQVLELFPHLKERLNQKAETLSGGEQQMLAIGRGLMSDPKLIMIDEMSLGLMPKLVERVMGVVSEIKKAGKTVLLVEQMVEEALSISDRGYVLQTGKIVLSGTGEELLKSDMVRKAYLGL